MPVYEYYTKDLLTDTLLAEFELSEVIARKQISAAGSLSGSIMLTPKLIQAGIMDGTQPSRTALYMTRDGEVIWSGIIWSRSYDSITQILTLTASTWESYFDHMVFWKSHFIKQRVRQEIILRDLVTELQAQAAAADIGITVMGDLFNSHKRRTVLIPKYEYHFGSEVVDQLVSADYGLEYYIDNDKVLRMGWANAQLNSSYALQVYDFPGGIAYYNLNENGTAGGTKYAALGAGNGNKVLRSVFTHSDELSAGYPIWWQVNNFESIVQLAALQALNSSYADRFGVIASEPTFVLQSARVPFTAWNALGASFKVRIQDVRYPDARTITSRLYGWELQPGSASTQEQLTFILEGDTA